MENSKSFDPKSFQVATPVKLSRKNGYVVADNQTIYSYLENKLIDTIPINNITKVKLQYGHMYIYTKGKLIFEKTYNYYFIDSDGKDLAEVAQDNIVFDTWQRFFESHSVKVIRASTVYKIFGR